ncbi:sugar transporter [Mycotypha africana]|uniref:sugar transporter n=1 Tax=Mycotypha africana TaxID=64632 RepID=UPI0023018E87|nr:sugar transporter [Mycotypha africana]KAI8971809.1 sugar transporter [Mycotypha africana]
MKVYSFWRVYALCGFLGLGGFMYELDSGVISAMLISKKFHHTFHWQGKPIAAALISVPLAAAGIICFLSGAVADKIGRRRFLMMACIVHIVGVILQLAIHTVPSFLAGKVIAGFSTGMYSVVCPLYQSEVSLPNHRGRLITMHQFGVTLGFCAAFWSAYACLSSTWPDSWSIPVALQILPPILMLAGLFLFIPESPRWLIYQNRHAEAKRILQKLRAKEDTDDLELSMEYIGIIQERNYDQNFTSKSYANLLSKGIDNNRGRTILGVGLHMMTQLTGINAILFYLPYILESTGSTRLESAMLGNGVSSMVNMLATIPSFFYVDRWGRRRILMCGSLSMASCMIIIAALQGAFSTKVYDYKPHVLPGTIFPFATSMTNDTAAFIILVFLCLFLGCFALSWGSMGWIYPAEIYPQSIRAKGLGVTTGASYAMSLCVSQVAPIMFKELSWGTYLFFGAVCLTQIYIVHRWYPETRVSCVCGVFVLVRKKDRFNEPPFYVG